MVENDRERNANREALTALRKKAKTTKTSVPSPFDSMMKDTHGSSAKALIQEVCSTCWSHDSTEPTWMMLPGTDLFAAVPFHAVHTMLEKGSSSPLFYWFSYFLTDWWWTTCSLRVYFFKLCRWKENGVWIKETAELTQGEDSCTIWTWGSCW